MKQLFLLLTIILNAHLAFGQADSVFVEQENAKAQYEKWMSDIGLNKFLAIDSLEQKDTLLLVYLMPQAYKGDSAKTVWESLKARYDTTHNFVLEEVLFYNAVNAFKRLPPHIELYILEGYESNCLWFNIAYSTGMKKIVTSQTICTPLPETDIFALKEAHFFIDIGDIQHKGVKIDTSNHLKNQKQIFKAIEKYARAKYTKSKKGKLAVFRPKNEKEDELNFMVEGLRQEVLTQKDHTWIETVLNYFAGENTFDWRPVEILKFKIITEQVDKTRIKITCTIEGRYASGYYETIDWDAGTPIDPEFNWYMQRYVDSFANELNELLKEE